MNVLNSILDINAVAGEFKEPWTKMRLDNILMPPFKDFAIFGEILRQVVKTKEDPNGHLYEESEYRMVIRILDGRLLMDGMYDAYAWKNDKVLKELSKYSDGKVPCIGTHDPTGEALLNFAKVLATIKDPAEKKKFAAMISQSAFDLLLVTTEEEKRLVIPVSDHVLQLLHEKGVYEIVDDWCYDTARWPDAELDLPGTRLEVGQFLICTQKGFYHIGHDEFLKSHKPGHNN